MTENETGSNDEFIDNFRQHLSKVDELSNVILKGHIEVEGHLDDVVDLIFFRPEFLRELRLGFYQKVQLAKAYCPDPAAKDWEVIRSLSEVRNSIAHREIAHARASRLTKLRETMSGWGSATFRKEVKVADEREVVVLATAVCCGFLIYVEDSVRKVRTTVAKSLDVPDPPEPKE